MQPMLRAIPLLAVALVAGHARAEAAVRPEDKIAPWVMEKTAAGGAAEFLVVLAPQADLAGARALTTKQAKGRFVRDALWDMAQATQGPILAELRARGVEHRAYYIVNMVWVKGDRALALALAARADVARIEGNPVIHNVLPEPEAPPAGAHDNDAPDAVEPGINFVRAPQVWALGFTGQGVVVGGQDTGYRWTHNALKPHYRGWNGTTASHDFNWHDSIHSGGGVCGFNSPVPCDDFFHGSHTMGTTVGDDGTGNQVGMAPGAKWIGCRNMDVGAGTPATYLECFEFFLAPYPVGQGPGQGDPALAPDVTVNSWTCPPGEGCAAGTLLTAVQAQRAAGIVTEASAGNAGPGCSTVTDPPAIYDESFSTGALNTGSDTLAGFSSWGPVTVDGSGRVKPDIAAPGTNTRSCDNSADNAYTTASGTSMAGPHVAGAVALLLSAVPSLSGNPDAIEQRLTDTAARNATNSTGLCGSTAGVYPNNLWGYGRLDVLCAVHGNLSGVSISVAGSTTVCPTCTGGTATVTDTGGGPATHQWGFRTTSGGAMTNIPGQTGISYVINGADFPGAGNYLLVERTTSTASCGAPLVSNEVPVTVTPVALSIGDVTVAEGNAGGTTASFSVTLSGPSGAVSVDYATGDGTASVADGDYAAASGTLTFAPGQTAQPLNVTVNGDTRFEANETFLVNLSNPQAAVLADGQGLGTIVNDDTATAADSRIELIHASRSAAQPGSRGLRGLRRLLPDPRGRPLLLRGRPGRGDRRHRGERPGPGADRIRRLDGGAILGGGGSGSEPEPELRERVHDRPRRVRAGAEPRLRRKLRARGRLRAACVRDNPGRGALQQLGDTDHGAGGPEHVGPDDRREHLVPGLHRRSGGHRCAQPRTEGDPDPEYLDGRVGGERNDHDQPRRPLRGPHGQGRRGRTGHGLHLRHGAPGRGTP